MAVMLTVDSLAIVLIDTTGTIDNGDVTRSLDSPVLVCCTNSLPSALFMAENDRSVGTLLSLALHRLEFDWLSKLEDDADLGPKDGLSSRVPDVAGVCDIFSMVIVVES